jgi:sulfur carrier protein ThiS
MERAGAVQHRVELLDVERRRLALVRREDLRRSLAELRAGVTDGARGADILLAVVVKLVDQGFLCVDQLVDNLHERRDCCGARLVDLLKDLAVPETFLVAVDDLVVPNSNAGVAVLEEPVGVVS